MAKQRQRIVQRTTAGLTFLQHKPVRRRRAFFRCDCGVERKIRYFDVLSGNTKSCGCLNRELAREAMTTLHAAWRAQRSGLGAPPTEVNRAPVPAASVREHRWRDESSRGEATAMVSQRLVLTPPA